MTAANGNGCASYPLLSSERVGVALLLDEGFDCVIECIRGEEGGNVAHPGKSLPGDIGQSFGEGIVDDMEQRRTLITFHQKHRRADAFGVTETKRGIEIRVAKFQLLWPCILQDDRPDLR